MDDIALAKKLRKMIEDTDDIKRSLESLLDCVEKSMDDGKDKNEPNDYAVELRKHASEIDEPQNMKEAVTAFYFSPEYLGELIEKAAHGKGVDFVYKTDLWEAYRWDCYFKRRTVLQKKLLYDAMRRFGCVDYNFCGKMSFWLPGKPKPTKGRKSVTRREHW